MSTHPAYKITFQYDKTSGSLGIYHWAKLNSIGTCPRNKRNNINTSSLLNVFYYFYYRFFVLF